MFSHYFKVLCRVVLYPAAFLALFGAFWRAEPFFSVTQIILFLFGLAVVGFLIVFEKRCYKKYGKTHHKNQRTNLTPLSVVGNSGLEQQTMRYHTESGTDRFEGTFLVEFLKGQLTSSVHIPFCPAFETTPQIEVFVLDADDVQTSVVQSQPFGVRIDVKRGHSDRLHLTVIAEEKAGAAGLTQSGS